MNVKENHPPSPTRRLFLIALGTTALTAPAMLAGRPLRAEDAAAEPFSFDLLTEEARRRAAASPPQPEVLAPVFKDLTYDDYQMIQFRPGRARWQAKGAVWNLLPFHLGWLFKEPVRLHEVVEGRATELSFTTDDFAYGGHLAQEVPAATALPGVAGFKLTHPLNRGDKMDEVVSFVGASYFRALGVGNTYGLSARGLAIDSGLAKAEEFPRFSSFWLERPAPGADAVTIHAALDSASVAGAYRFVVRPGVETVIDVTARLFFRREVEQLGIAPLTSMFLFADVNRARFDDYRPRVHDSNGLRIVRADGDVIWRALGNPRALAFGLIGNALACLLLPLIGRTQAGALLGLTLFYITFEFIMVSHIPLMTEIMPGARATMLSFNLTGHSLGRALGAFLAAFIYRQFGFFAVTLLALVFNLFGLLALRRLAQDARLREA
jgi:glucans biosynthesis protein